MTVKIIVDNQIEETDFLSATEQEGIYIGQPIPDVANTGSMRPITIGDENGTINDYVYEGTITGDRHRLANSSFEKVFTAGLAQSWDKFGASQTYEEEGTIIHDGRTSQKVTVVADGETCGIAQDLQVSNGLTYRIAVWVYCNENTTVTIAHANLTGNSDTFAINATTWTRCVWQVDADATGTEPLQIYRAIGDSDPADYLIIDDLVCSLLGLNIMNDTALMVFDNKALIGAKIEFTSGTNDGDLVTVTDNQGDSGYVAFAGLATTEPLDGDTYTLTIVASDLDMEVEMMTAGDIGDAKFKWSFNGGANDIAREYTMGGGEHASVISSSWGDDGAIKVVEMPNGVLMAAYGNALDEISYRTSVDQGVSWSAETVIEDDDAFYMEDVLVLSTNRIMIFAWLGAGLGTDIFYSDDNAATWSEKIHVAPDFKCVIELPNKNLLGFNDENDDIRCQVSNDGGWTWGTEITVVQEANDQLNPSACLAANGDVVCAYDSDETTITDPAIFCKISSDGGATWGSEISIHTFGGGLAARTPWVFTYPNGTIYVFFIHERTAGVWNDLYNMQSVDNGLTWTDPAVFILPYYEEVQWPRASVVFGTMVWVSYGQSAWAMGHTTFRHHYPIGGSTLYGVVTAVNNILQSLYCDVRLRWQGGAAVVGDKWTFLPKWIYSMKNLVSNSPDKTWRSETDGAASNIVIAKGANERFHADGVALFNCNFRTASFQMHSSDTWGAPTLDSAFSFDITTAGVTDLAVGNMIKDTALLADYKDHELKGFYFRATSGVDDTLTWKIKDNQGDYIILDTIVAHNVAAPDTFAIFGVSVAKTFAENTLRYIRLSIDAQQTAEDYYQAGTMVAGHVLTLSKAWLIGYSKSIISGVEYLRPTDGSMVPVIRKDNKKTFTVAWNGSEDTVKELEAMYSYLRGKNLALIPDDSDLTDVYLCKVIGDFSKTHWFKDRWNFSINFEEV